MEKDAATDDTATDDTATDVEFEGTSEILEVEVFDDHADVRNRIETTMTPPDGDPVRHSGHTLSILR